MKGDITEPAGTGFHPGLAIDMVIFGFHEGELKILLLEYTNTDLLALPGGFVQKDEDLNRAALRVLTQRTSLTDIYLEQFYTFGSCTRFDPISMQTILKAKNIAFDPQHWLLQRFVSVGYYALVDFTKAIPHPDDLSDNCQWYDLKDLPILMQDHNRIVGKALQTLQLNLDRKLIGFNLLEETFTMNDLQGLYETILGEPLRRSSFQRKILGMNILERVDKKWTGGAHKAPYLYKFKKSHEPSLGVHGLE